MSRETLTSEQIKPVNSDCRVNVCYACPGSGKTTVLLHRAQRLSAETREPILVCTFSRKAAEDINKRLTGSYLANVEVKTIHSLCFSLVKTHWQLLGNLVGGDKWPLEPRLISKGEELALISLVFPNINAPQFYEKVEELRKWPVSPSAATRMIIQGAYLGKITAEDSKKWASYETYRISRGYVNFDDMIGLANLLLPMPEVSVTSTRRYTHLLIDEAQDTSEHQWNVLRPLVASAKTTLAVGDMNQSIYGWRNADGSVLSSLALNKEAVTFRLTQTFRSGSFIADLANLLVWDKSSQIKSNGETGSTILKGFEKPEDEVAWVLKQVDPESAIISRTNAYLEPFEREAILRGIPYRGVGFYRAPHIREVANFICSFSGEDAIPIIEKAYVENNTYTSIEKQDFKQIISIIKTNSLEYFLDLIDKAEITSDDGVILTTGHAAKGLEWDKVFVVGCHPQHVPHKLSKDEREETNLLYVMITRARKALTISYIGEPSRILPKEYVNGVRPTN